MCHVVDANELLNASSGKGVLPSLWNNTPAGYSMCVVENLCLRRAAPGSGVPSSAAFFFFEFRVSSACTDSCLHRAFFLRRWKLEMLPTLGVNAPPVAAASIRSPSAGHSPADQDARSCGLSDSLVSGRTGCIALWHRCELICGGTKPCMTHRDTTAVGRENHDD